MNRLALEIAERIRERRLALGLSKSQLSLQAGLSRSYVRKIEEDGVRITVEKLLLISRVLNCTITDLIPPDHEDLLN
ncbi:helix-turn-helix transcriptional regulator [Vibrio sp. 1CM24A]|jgi:transcriptional regulator with XRE-family HTH domain|uniref:helix-turn-helix domain-containing protein n=1 Tax=Vibrio sp. 1CM24A TaxID=2929165 RepID=UPI0020BF3F49|nr:helix-turn-helix transcriptional regulator [Vibrio sp. 1CM24A]MCK8083653.1 helix-turn-helix domain-containing protein [Vibrio sp. 1CM24A]